mmetsp:Transcript_34899/g.67885  ORF Transcript_34899/g.67885 Transcript_34899/m.67885 type:complete len:469 (+) Transcript_34899:396-1802(+)
MPLADTDEVPLIFDAPEVPSTRKSPFPEFTKEDMSTFEVWVRGKPYGLALDQDMRVVGAHGLAAKEGIMPGDELKSIKGQAVEAKTWKNFFIAQPIPFCMRFSRKQVSMGDLLLLQRHILQAKICKSRWTSMKKHPYTCHGVDLLTWMVRTRRCVHRCQAEGMAMRLMQSGLMRRIEKPHDVFNDNRDLYDIIVPERNGLLHGSQDVSFHVRGRGFSISRKRTPGENDDDDEAIVEDEDISCGSTCLREMIKARLNALRATSRHARPSLPPSTFHALTNTWLNATKNQADAGAVDENTFVKELSQYLGEVGSIAPRRLFWCMADKKTKRVDFETWLNGVTLWELSDFHQKLRILFDVFDRSQTGYWSREEVKDLIRAVSKKRIASLALVLREKEDHKHLEKVGADLLRAQLDDYVSFFSTFFTALDADMDDRISPLDLMGFAEGSQDKTIAAFISRFAIPLDALFILR